MFSRRGERPPRSAVPPTKILKYLFVLAVVCYSAPRLQVWYIINQIADQNQPALSKKYSSLFLPVPLDNKVFIVYSKA